MDFLKQNEISFLSTNSDLKVFFERFDRTLLDLIKEPMYIEGKACWLNHLDTDMENYNNRVHGTTKMTPFEMSTNNELIPNNINNNNAAKLASHKLPKFQVGDFVRVPDKRNIYSKGYTTNWNRELFKIHKVNKTNAVTYGLIDENNEQIEGKYYEQELLGSVFNFKSKKNVRKYENFPSI